MIEGFVLAGGASRRMGQDKARLILDGVPMALRVAETLASGCDRVRLVRKDDDDWTLDVVCDPSGSDHHPLWGVAAALKACEAPRALFAPCDVPHLTIEAVGVLISNPMGVAFDGERVHPLVAVLPTSWADRAAEAARQGLSARAFVSELPRVRLPADVLRNLNAPGDLSGG